MAQTYSLELAGIDATPVKLPSTVEAYGARLKRFRATIPFASQAIGDTVVIADIPARHILAYFVINATATLGTTTLAIGTSISPTSYAVATTFTTPGVPKIVIDASAYAQDTEVKRDDVSLRLILTIGAAALPSGGNGDLVIDTYASYPN